MDKTDELLKYIQKTNPDMTKEKLIEELSKCRCVTNSLVAIFERENNQNNCFI